MIQLYRTILIGDEKKMFLLMHRMIALFEVVIGICLFICLFVVLLLCFTPKIILFRWKFWRRVFGKVLTKSLFALICVFILQIHLLSMGLKCGKFMCGWKINATLRLNCNTFVSKQIKVFLKSTHTHLW